MDATFAIRQLQEKCTEPNMSIYSVFIDLTKAFNTINWKAICMALESNKCRQKCEHIVQLFYDGMTGQVLIGADVTDFSD